MNHEQGKHVNLLAVDAVPVTAKTEVNAVERNGQYDNGKILAAHGENLFIAGHQGVNIFGTEIQY